MLTAEPSPPPAAPPLTTRPGQTPPSQPQQPEGLGPLDSSRNKELCLFRRFGVGRSHCCNVCAGSLVKNRHFSSVASVVSTYSPHPPPWGLEHEPFGHWTGDRPEHKTSQHARHCSSRLGLVGYDRIPAPSLLRVQSPLALSLSSCRLALEGSSEVLGHVYSPAGNCTKPSLQEISEILAKIPPLPRRPFSERRPKTEVKFPASQFREPCSNDMVLCRGSLAPFTSPTPSTLDGGNPNCPHHACLSAASGESRLAPIPRSAWAGSPAEASGCSVLILWLPAHSMLSASPGVRSGAHYPARNVLLLFLLLPGVERLSPQFKLYLGSYSYRASSLVSSVLGMLFIQAVPPALLLELTCCSWWTLVPPQHSAPGLAPGTWGWSTSLSTLLWVSYSKGQLEVFPETATDWVGLLCIQLCFTF